MEAHMVIGALLEHAKHSLKCLSLTGPCDLHDGQSQIYHCNGSLQDFEVLHDVVLHSHVNIKTRLGFAHLVDVLHSPIQTIHRNGADAWYQLPGLLGNFSGAERATFARAQRARH